MAKDTHTLTDAAFDLLTGDEAETPNQLTDAARNAEPANFLRHAGALTMSKLADGLIDPKLVLSWLLNALGTPAAFVSLLVPVREAGALLPQLFTAPRIRAMARRKWAWAGGSLGQGLAAAAMVLAALALSGASAGAVIVAALGVLAVSRSVCSVSYKDVLGKTVGKSRRGTVTGLAGSAASVGVIALALLLLSGTVPRFGLVVAAVALAAALWLAAALLFATLQEEAAPGDPGGGQGLAQLGLLARDAQLRRFVLARCLLLPTALAPPYLVLLATRAGDTRFSALGSMVLASAVAALISAYVWGRLADRSSRKVLVLTGVVAAAFLILAVALDRAGLMGSVWAAPLSLFGLMVAYQGVRRGRSTYLVDMAPKDNRAAYTAVANTTVGLVLLLAGAGGAAAARFGPVPTLIAFAALCLAAAAVAWWMEEA